MQTGFLVIGDAQDVTWLQDALTALGASEVMSEEAARRCQTLQRYVLILIDTTSVPDYVSLIAYIRQHAPAAKVIIVTASPSWPYARDAFRAGAADYLSKAMRPRDLLATLVAILRPPRPMSHRSLPQAPEASKETT